MVSTSIPVHLSLGVSPRAPDLLDPLFLSPVALLSLLTPGFFFVVVVPFIHCIMKRKADKRY